MSDLERLRHSCAHVMATAIAKLWPDAQFAAYGDQMAGMAVLVDSCADDPTQCEACAWPGGGRGAGGECIGRK